MMLSIHMINFQGYSYTSFTQLNNTTSCIAVFLPQCTDCNQPTPLLGLCLSSLTVVATSVILLLATQLLTPFSTEHVCKVLFPMSCQHDSKALKDGTKLTHSQLQSACNMFKLCYQCKNLRQTEQVTNMVPNSPPLCKQPNLCQLQTFLQTLMVG